MQSGPGEALILFIDDDPLQRRLLPGLLGSIGAEVATAANAEAAAESLAARLPRLILCDAVMPGTDGFALCQRLKGAPATRKIPFAIITSLSQKVGERSLQAGADDWFLKKDSQVLLRLRIKLLLAISGAGLAAPLEAFAGARVLAASSSAHILSQLTQQLAPAGITMDTCSGPETLLAKLQGPPPNLLILDTQLGDRPLAEFTTAVRTCEAWAEVPILVVAGKEDGHTLDAQEFRIQDWVTRPLDGREARRRVLMLLRYGRALGQA